MRGVDSGRALATRIVTERKARWIAYAVVVAVLALLTLFPRPYVARAKILPQENGSAAGVGSMMDVLGGKLNDYSALLGQRNSIETYLIVARSNEVTNDVIRRLHLVGPDGYRDIEAASDALAKKVDLHALLGGVMEIEASTHDKQEAQDLAAAYLDAINKRIGVMSRQQVGLKRDLVLERFQEASVRVAQTGNALNAFRQRYHLADPQAQFGAAVSLRTQLEGDLQTKTVELETLRRFSGEENPQLRSVETEIAALKRQIAQTNQAGQTAAGLNLTAQTQISNQYLNLYRDYRLAQSLFEIYSRFSEQVELQELAAQTNADVQIIEAPHVDPERHVNVTPAAALVAVLLVIVFLELYVPATDLRLPWADRAPAE